MRVLTVTCTLLLGIGASSLAGCGDRSNLISGRDADALKARIGAVEQAAGSRDCAGSDAALHDARVAVGNLPATVDQRLKDRLRSGLQQLQRKAQDACQAPAATTTTVTPTTTTTTEAAPVTTDTQAPETTSTDTSPTTPADPTTTDSGGTTATPPPTDTAPPPDDGGAPPTDIPPPPP